MVLVDNAPSELQFSLSPSLEERTEQQSEVGLVASLSLLYLNLR